MRFCSFSSFAINRLYCVRAFLISIKLSFERCFDQKDKRENDYCDVFFTISLFRSRSVTLTKRRIKTNERKTCRNWVVFRRVLLWLMFISSSTWKSWIREYDLKIDLNRIDFRNTLRKFENHLSWTLNQLY